VAEVGRALVGRRAVTDRPEVVQAAEVDRAVVGSRAATDPPAVARAQAETVRAPADVARRVARRLTGGRTVRPRKIGGTTTDLKDALTDAKSSPHRRIATDRHPSTGLAPLIAEASIVRGATSRHGKIALPSMGPATTSLVRTERGSSGRPRSAGSATDRARIVRGFSADRRSTPGVHIRHGRPTAVDRFVSRKSIATRSSVRVRS
jgi:hypothetical protein